MTEHWTDDPDHPTHQRALTVRCPLCHAQPGDPCRSLTGRPLTGRYLHYSRTETRR